MNLLLIGPPGSGKGTQAEILEKKFGFKLLSTGAILRSLIAEGNKDALEVKRLIEGGKLIPDEKIIKIMGTRILHPDCLKGFILDGFPRTVGQAIAFDSMLASAGVHLDVVIKINIDDKLVLERIVGRFSCSTCGALYHKTLKPPKQSGVCDICGGKDFTIRADDEEKKVRVRIEDYHRKTEPLAPYYKSKRLLHEVNGAKSIEDVAKQIGDILDKVGRK